MLNNIVICCDGTWNRPEQNSSDCASNVLKLSRLVNSQNGGILQQVFYDWGLGSYHDTLRAGMTGYGLDKNVLDAYRYIVHNYNDQSQLFLFGFSRGAYTVRALSGLINNIGILKSEHGGRIYEAWQIYKSGHKRDHPKGLRATAFKAHYAHTTSRIRFIGVWDTVGALGIPFSLLGWLNDGDEFYDTELSSDVEIARQALAIDERRQDFEPALWQAKTGVDLKQVWFAGVHSDVGGGYAPDAMGLNAADEPLNWLLKEAEAAGLIVAETPKMSLNLGRLHRSRRHVFRIKRPLVRDLQIGTEGIFIHSSVLRRWQSDKKYRPTQIVKLLKAMSIDHLPWCD